ncbi:MAG: glycosyltransferase family 4 protein [Bacteroidia bacterium]
MRIAFISHYIELYGANRSLLNLILPLRSKGIEPIVILPAYGELATKLEEEKIEYIIEPFGLWMGVLAKTKGIIRQLRNRIRFKKLGNEIKRKNLIAVEKIFNKIKGRHIDLVYSNTSVINIGFELAKKLQVPHIWHIREFGKKDYDVIPFAGRNNFLKILRASDHIIFISKVLKHYFEFDNDKNNSVIYNGVLSKQKSLQLDTTYPPGNETVFALVGLILENKGQQDAIHAFARLNLKYPATRLLIAGNGADNETQMLINLIEKYELNNKIEMLGYVDDPFSVYKRSHAVLMCSRNEAMGRVTVEAFHSARPVLGFKSGATPELIDHMENGLLFDSEIEGLYNAMEWVVLNKEKCVLMGKNAKSKSLNLYTTEKYSEEVYSVINKVLSKT